MAASAFLLLTILMGGCGSKSTPHISENIFTDAEFIRGEMRADSSVNIRIVNPWDTTALLADYLLVNDGTSTSDALSDAPSAMLLKLPMERVVVFSSIHAALLAELGYADAIVGVADAAYIKTPEITSRLADGRIMDVGSSMEPSLEKIIALRPQAILVSPFQNQGHGVLDKAGIPVIECADYMETTPLGRAEWSRFYAMLVQGISPANDTLFDAAKERYTAMVRQAAAEGAAHPRVITELPQSGTWMMPGGRSYAARMLQDAGALYPFASDASTGSLTMSYEKVFMEARDADIWLLRTFGPTTLEDVRANHEFNQRLRPYQLSAGGTAEGGIYVANTQATNLFEETPFHPDLLLADYVAIFHHTPGSLRYFVRLK